MPRVGGSSKAHIAGSHGYILTVAGLDLDYRLCLVAAAGVALACCVDGEIGLLVVALAFLGAEGSAMNSKCHPQQAPKTNSARAGDAVSVGMHDGSPKAPREHPACQRYVKLIVDHACAEQCTEALGLLTEMRQLSITPSVACYTALISACDKGKQPERALELFDTMQKEGLKPTAETYNALISLCCNGKMLEKALQMRGEMQVRGLTPNVATYTSLIRACGQNRHPQRAWQVYDAMKEVGDNPTVETFVSLMETAESCQNPVKALRFFAEMLDEGLSPDIVAYNCAIRCCEHMDDAEKATKIFEQMKEQQVIPDANTYETLIRVCGKCKSPSTVSHSSNADRTGLTTSTDHQQPRTTAPTDQHPAATQHHQQR